VDLPKKHGRGGQSAVRFARLRVEKRHNYVRKVAEMATQMFIQGDKPNITGLILAGSADFKTVLSQSDMFDVRLQPLILQLVDVSYGGEAGFNQAIELSAECLGNVKFVREKKVIKCFFDEIAQDTGKFIYGIKDTLSCLEAGAVKILIVWETLEMDRYKVRNSSTDEEKELFLTREQTKDQSNFHDKATGVELDILESLSVVEWMANCYKQWGCELEFVTDRSPEGSQFCKGFGGVGGVLRCVQGSVCVYVCMCV
jgi:peptide chain release factor subunit 1